MYGKAMFISLFLFLPSLLFSAGGRGIEAEKEADKPVLRIGKQYALLIGISAYKQWTPLRNPVHDLREISGILTSRYRYGKKNVIELYDRKATKANIIRTFETLQKQLTPDDSLLILYSGHGHLDDKTNSGFWIPVDSGKDVYKQENWLPNSQIRGLVSNIEANHVLLLVDSCFSGDIIDGTRSITGMNDYFVNAYSHVSRQVITSGASETVPDNSEFCRQLKRILKQNREPYLDSIILYNEIRLGMRKTLPVIGSLSGTGHQDGSSFLIFLKEEEIPAEIEISARVDGSIVLDGEEQGTIRAGKSSTLEVKAGNHTVAVRYDEENREEKTLSIGGGEKSSLVFTWEPKRFGALSITTEQPGTLHIDGSPYGSIDAGTAVIGDLEAGNHTLIMVYTDGRKAEREIEVIGETETEVRFPPPETGKRMVNDDRAVNGKAHTIGINGSLAVPVLYKEDGALMPSAGVELSYAWRFWGRSFFHFSLMASGTYSFHREGKDISNETHLHLATACCGAAVSMDMPFDKRWSLVAALLGGAGLTVIESGFHDRTFYMTDPAVMLQFGVGYRISGDLLITGKGAFVTLIDGGEASGWYSEVFIGLGIGMSF